MQGQDFFSGLDAAKAGIDRQSAKSLDALLMAVRELSRAIDPRSALPVLAEAVRHLLNGSRSVVVIRDTAEFAHWSAADADGKELKTPIPEVAERMRRLRIDAPVHLGHEGANHRFAVVHLGKYGWLYVDGGEKMRATLDDSEMSVLGLVSAQAQVLIENGNTLNAASQLGHRGVSDKDYFQRRLREEASRASRYARPFTLIVVSFDNANALTQQLGATRVPRLTEMIAGRLRDALREIDLIALLGPLHFALMLPETPRPPATHEVLHGLADRLYATLDGVRLDAGHLVALEPRIIALAHTSKGAIDTDELLADAIRLSSDKSGHPVSCALR